MIRNISTQPPFTSTWLVFLRVSFTTGGISALVRTRAQRRFGSYSRDKGLTGPRVPRRAAGGGCDGNISPTDISLSPKCACHPHVTASTGTGSLRRTHPWRWAFHLPDHFEGTPHCSWGSSLSFNTFPTLPGRDRPVKAQNITHNNS